MGGDGWFVITGESPRIFRGLHLLKVMIWGDEPMTHSDMISEGVQLMLDASRIQIVNLLGEIEDDTEFEDRIRIKIVCDIFDNAS